MATRPISPQDHERIATAIRAAELKTDGRDLLRRRACQRRLFLYRRIHGDDRNADRQPRRRLWAGSLVAVDPAAAFRARAASGTGIGAHFVCGRCPALRIHLVPRRQRYKAAHDNALRQFLARNVHRTTARTGVLVFVLIAERYAEVVADSGINSKVGQHVWDGVIRDLTQHAGDDRLADGFVKAIGQVGAVLAEHFPVTSGDANQLDDHLVEI